MAVSETNIVHEIQKAISPLGARLWKNVRGMFLTLDGSRKVQAGLQAQGSSDLIGFMPVVITPEHVGKTLPIFTCIEVKTATGRVSPEQAHFVEFVRKSGGLSGVARSADDAVRILGG